jgi:hypothetical protein
MNSRSKSIILIVVISLLTTCIWISFIPCQDLVQASSDKPFYIDEVWPPAGTRISFICYAKKTLTGFLLPKPSLWEENATILSPDGGVAVTIFPDTLIKEMSGKNPSFPNRVFIYVDGKEIDTVALDKGTITIKANTVEEFKNYVYVPKWYYFGSYPVLFPGEHMAQFVILKKDGTTLKYEWTFMVTWW